MPELQLKLIALIARSSTTPELEVTDSRSHVLSLSFPEAGRRALKPDGDTLFECLDGSQEYNPYTDTDHLCNSPERPPQEFIDGLQEKVLENWCELVGLQGYEGCELLMATRHGLVEGKGSCSGASFVPLFCKSETDRRVLEPYHDRPLERFMVQNLTGDERVLEYHGDEAEDVVPDGDEGEVQYDSPRYAPPWDILERVVMALSLEKRCDDGTYEAWCQVGWALAGVARVARRWSEGFRLWTRFSRQCIAAYDAGKAWSIYHDAKRTGPQLGWRSLIGWLQEDDPSAYKRVLEDLPVRATPSQTVMAQRVVESTDGHNLIEGVAQLAITGRSGIKDLANFCASFNDMKARLETDLGFQNVALLQEREAGFNFEADQCCNCPLCAAAGHSGNAFYCIQVVPRVFVVRNYANKCRQGVLGWEDHRQLQNLLLTPDSDAPYVDLFESHFGRRLKWTGKHFLFFRDHLWRQIPTGEVYNTLSSMANVMLERLLQSLAQRQIELDMYNGDKQLKTLNKEQYQGVLKGIKYVKRNSNLRGMLEMTKNRLISDVEQSMNANPYLLGTENGVLDLFPGKLELRDGQPEDMISKSVGYSVLDKDENFDATIWEEVTQVIQSIYPIQDERDIIQRWSGYCLLGEHPEKKLCMLTDARNGFNGKSFFTKMLRAALGDEYSRKPAPELLYKTDFSSSTVNSHISGLLDFRDVRLAVIEELDSKKHLNNSLIKDLNGGNTTLRGRQCGSADSTSLRWITKLILSFNNQCMPNFDYTDPALVERFLMIRHRSRFFADADELAAQPPDSFSYKADAHLDKQLDRWRPYILKWCLDGLEQYHGHGFDNIPACCDAWKRELVSNQDLMADFVASQLRQGNQGDYVYRKQLFLLFNENYRDNQRDPKTKISPTKFFSHIKGLLGENSWKARHNGIYDAFLGWRIVEAEERTA